MAGIGFILRQLTKREDILGLVEAYMRASIVSAGPWLITVATLTLIMIFGKELMPIREALNFQSIIIYNFCFSLVLTAPFSLPATRVLADNIYLKDLSATPGMVVGTLALIYAIETPLALWFYFIYADLTFFESLFAVYNFLLISTIWMLAIYLTALANYEVITRSFIYGMCIGVVLTIIAAFYQRVDWMLLGFNVGVSIIAACIAGEIFVEYPYLFKEPFKFIGSLYKYREVLLSGLIFNAAIWVDKWVMWTSPDAITLPNNLTLYPSYDSAAFLAYFTSIPAMALFLINIETKFFEKYLRFYEEIRRGATFKKIVENQQELREVLLQQGRNALVLQGLVGILTIVMAPKIFELLNVNYMELGMFRLLVVGASYQTLILFLSIVLWYFDNRKKVLLMHVIFFITNLVFTYIVLGFGFTYYGLGFAASTLLTFIVGSFLNESEIRDLPYQTFIAHNKSINRER